MSLPIGPRATRRILDLPDEDRPREKLHRRGHRALTDAELLAILIGSGTSRLSALDLARRLLRLVEGNLHALGGLSAEHFAKIKGIGPAKSAKLLAALELGRRRAVAVRRSRPVLTDAQDVYELLGPTLGDLLHEEFHVLCLNRAGELLTRFRLSSGGSSATVVDAKQLFAKTLAVPGVTSLVLIHNHPSGRREPSDADVRVTHRLVEAAALLDLAVVDHVIVTAFGYYSFAEDEKLTPPDPTAQPTGPTGTT